MPNRAIYENSFKSTIWYSKKLKDTKKINDEFIKLAGFTDEDIERIDRELLLSKHKNDESKVAEHEQIIIKKIIEKEPSDSQSKPQPESQIQLEIESKGSEEEQIMDAVIARLNEMEHA
jgi:CRISPR/Cas system type I-B associated protein Csh2 (Cas7 group RAMP superfamily)